MQPAIIMGTGKARPHHFIVDEIFHALRSKAFHPAQQDFTAEGDFTSEFVPDKFRFVGPTTVLVSGDTLQLKDYSKTDWPWTMFDPQAKQRRHDSVFPDERRKAYACGASLAR